METIEIIKFATSITAITTSILAMFTVIKYSETRSSQDYEKWVICFIVWLFSILIHYLCKQYS